MAKKESLYDRADKKLHKWAGTIGAIIAIMGALTGALNWAQAQFTNAMNSQMEGLKAEIQASDREQTQAITRVELLMLMTQDPENKAAIEKMARYYFKALDGDLWMTSRYSSWAREYGGDTTIVIGVD